MADPSDRARRPTSIDVAAAARVSQSTVSRALRGDRSITLATRERVKRIASELGYYPDARAVRLRQGSTRIVAVVLLFAEGDERQSFNPFYYEVASAVQAAAARRGIGVLLSGQGHSSSLRSDFEQRSEADGIVVIGSAANRTGWDFFARHFADGVNIVAWGAPDDRLPTIRADNRSAGELAAQHLLSLGRRNLAFVGPGWQTHVAFRHRKEGFCAELERNGYAPLGTELGAEGHDRGEQGQTWINGALSAEPHLDGVFAASDSLAAGVIRGLSPNGRRVPDDVAVVGFDGGYGAKHFFPSLTTIEQNVVAAGDLLVNAVMAGRNLSAASDLPLVPVRLIVRESTKSRVC